MVEKTTALAGWRFLGEKVGGLFAMIRLILKSDQNLNCSNLFKNWFMISLRLSSYGCTQEVSALQSSQVHP